MTADELTELQRIVDAGTTPTPEQCEALIAEIWRLKTGMTAKGIEVDYWRGNSDEYEHKFHGVNEANEQLRNEIDQLKAVHGLPSCALENRWSNCAVRLKKREREHR